MSRRTKIMGHMTTYYMEVTDQIKRTQSEKEYCWTLQRGEGTNTHMILVLNQIGAMMVIGVILIGGVIRIIFHRS